MSRKKCSTFAISLVKSQRRVPARGGQTGCYALAFEKAKGDYILRMDADLQDDPLDLPAFAAKLERGADLVMGLRECRKHPRLLKVASLLYDMFILILFDTPLHSNSGSFVAFKADLVKNIPWRKNDHRYLPLIAIRRGAKNVREVLVRHNIRVSGVSKYSPLHKVIMGIPEALRFIVRLYRGVYDLPQK
jgi:glycosyltransferase involved in cell wall biosynthesis